MRRLAAFVVSALSAIAISVPAWAQQQFPSAFVSIDGVVFPLAVERSEKLFLIGTDTDPIVIESANGDEVRISASADPDPSILYALGVVDFGAPSIFGFGFGIPIVPVGAPNIVSGSIVGGLTDFTGDGVTLTPLAPAVFGIPADADAITEAQVSGVGPAFASMGVDVGLLVSGAPGTAGALTPYGPFAAGPIPGPGPGPWTLLATETNFSLTGGGDAAALTGFASIDPVSIPEPTTLLLLGCLIAVAGVTRRRIHPN